MQKSRTIQNLLRIVYKSQALNEFKSICLTLLKYISLVTIPGCMIKHSHTFKTGSASLVVPKSARPTSITTPPIRTA